jgi:glycosyltransferase involved in cell wall biosynthesis
MQIASGGRIAYEPRAVSYFRQHGANTSVSRFTCLDYYEEHYRIAKELRRVYGLSDERLRAFFQRVQAHYFRHFDISAADDFHRVFDLQGLLASPRTVRHIALGILGFRTGGAELFPIHLANELLERGHHISLLVLDADAENADIRRLLRPQIPVYERLLIEDIGPNVFFASHGVDVVHTHYQGVDLWIHDACRVTHTPYVVTLHGSHDVANLSADVLDSLVAAVDRWVYTADKNLRVFDNLLADPGVVTKLPNAVPERRGTFPVSREQLAPEKDAVLFGMASRALRAKGWDIAIDALGRVRRETKRPVYLALCGDGDDYDDLVRLYCSRAGVTFLGFQVEIAAFYRTCDCCVLPTRFSGESFPFTLIESLKAGTPIIATDIGEIRNIIESHGQRAGIIVPVIADDQRFTAAISEAMLEMLHDDHRAGWAKAAALLGPKYSFEALTSAYEEIYRGVLTAGVRA